MLMMKIFVFINGVGTQGGMFLYPIPLIETKLTGMIGKRLQRLSKQQSSSNYSRQKNSLEKELASFLSSLSSPKLSFSGMEGP